MPDTFATTGRPTTAAVAWADADSIYIEFPVRGGQPPYIVRQPKTAEGLRLAFGALIENPAPKTVRLAHPAIRRATGSEAVRAEAASIVRRLLGK